MPFRQNRYGYNDNEIRVFKFRSMFHRPERLHRRTPDHPRRPAHHARRPDHPQDQHRRAAAAVQRAAGQHVDGRPASPRHRHQSRRGAVRSGGERIQFTPPGQAGITGWAQINGYRGETDTLFKIQKRVEYDLEYISKWSVWFDLYIVFMTVPAVLSTKEVYR